jgi:hypothetical protein
MPSPSFNSLQFRREAAKAAANAGDTVEPGSAANSNFG